MNTTHTYSYWEQDSFFKPYDLVIVGAGIVGLSTALFYKKAHPGRRVAVVDKGFIPEGASTRNAGFACIGSIGEHLADLEKESEKGVKQRIKTRYEGLRLLRETLGDRPIGYEACGGYELFLNDELFARAADHIGLFNEWLAELVGEKEVYTTDSMNGCKVIRNRLEGALHPGKMMRELVRRASQNDVEIKWNSPVSSVSPEGEVVLEGGPELKAEKVLIAANGFVKNIIPEIPVKPARGLVLVTEKLKEQKWKGIFHHDRGFIYFRDLQGRLLLGGARNIDSERETTSDFGVNRTIRDYLLQFADDALGLEEGWKSEYEWSGIMGFSDSKSPIVEGVDDRRFIAAGLSGMGVAIGTAIGRKAAALLNQ